MSTDRRTRGRGNYHGELNPNARHATRTLSKQGNSICIPVPQPFMRAMNVFPGDRLELIYDFELCGFFVRATERQAPRPIDDARLREIVGGPR